MTNIHSLKAVNDLIDAMYELMDYPTKDHPNNLIWFRYKVDNCEYYNIVINRVFIADEPTDLLYIYLVDGVDDEKEFSITTGTVFFTDKEIMLFNNLLNELKSLNEFCFE